MEPKSSPISNEDTKTCVIHQTDENKIKTSPKDYDTILKASDASKSCDVTEKDSSNITMNPKIKTPQKDYSSSTTDQSKKDCQDVKDEKGSDETSGARVTNIPKPEEKLIKSDPYLYQVRLKFVVYTLFKCLIFLFWKNYLYSV